MGIKQATRSIAALSGSPDELTEEDLVAAAALHNRDDDPETISQPELDRYFDAHDVDWLSRRLAKSVLFSERVCGTDRKLSPKEAMNAALARFGDGTEVGGVRLRRG